MVLNCPRQSCSLGLCVHVRAVVTSICFFWKKRHFFWANRFRLFYKPLWNKSIFLSSSLIWKLIEGWKVLHHSPKSSCASEWNICDAFCIVKWVQHFFSSAIVRVTNTHPYGSENWSWLSWNNEIMNFVRKKGGVNFCKCLRSHLCKIHMEVLEALWHWSLV